MGAARHNNGFALRLAGLRRVVRRGETFICGVCRSCYDDEREALSCIDRCWQETLELDPVVPARRALKLSYRCRFCARDYDARAAAASCARDCREARSKKYSREAELVDDGGELPPPPRRNPRARLVRVAQPMAVARPRSKLQAKSEEPKVGGDEHGSTFNADVRLQVAEQPRLVEEAPLAPVSKKAKASDDSEKFFRDGAQYVCKECSKKYFTRVEVIICYDGH